MGVVGKDEEIARLRKERDVALERFRLMAQAVKGGMWDWDMRTNVAWYSDGMFDVFGLDRKVTATFERWMQLMHDDDRERVLSGFRQIIEGGAAEWSAEYRLQRPADGRIVEVWDRACVLLDDAGRPERIVGVAMDVTEQRALERQLQQSQKMEVVGQLAGGIAHDFNNMLQAATIELALARAVPGTPPGVLVHVNAIAAVIERATSLTRQLMLFGRREAMRLQTLDLNVRVRDLATLLQRLLGEHVVVELALDDEGSLRVDADASMLDQVLINLAVNARDAMPAGGTLSIATARHTRDERAGRPAGSYVCLEVRDTGSGIAPDVLPHIFEPFYTTKDVNGTGLGLATAHGIVEQHRGWIEVDSKLGAGTTFRVFWPASRASAVERDRAEAAPVPSPSGAQETLLVVEDDDAVRRAVCELLESAGYEVLAAGSGPEALKVWEQHRATIDLVLTDLVMPGGMSGHELATLLSARVPALEVIIMTGHTRDRDAMKLGATAYAVLHKPIDVDHLLSMIRTALDG